MNNKLLRRLNYRHTALRYVLSGIAAFLTEYVFFLVIYEMTLKLLFSNVLSFFGGLAVSFTAQKMWTFHDKDRRYRHTSSRQALFFSGLSLINLIISTASIEVLRSAGFKPFLSKICVMVVVAIWNFVIFKYGIFRKITSSEG